MTNQTMHKFNDKWTLYFFKPDKVKQWKDNMYKIANIDSIESYWGLMHHLKPVSTFEYGYDYYLFRSHIEPMWENEFNKNGGTWVIASHKSQRNTRLDEMWIEIQMALLGEIMDIDSDMICGAAINVRGNFDKITIWTNDSRNIEANRRIGLKLKSLLNIKQTLEYIPHSKNGNKSVALTV